MTTTAEGQAQPKARKKRAAPKPPEPEQEAQSPDGEEGEGGKPMSFWEHLDELRTRLIRSLIGLFIGCAVAWFFHAQILQYLQAPYVAAWHAAGLPGEATINQSAPTAGFFAYVKLALIGGAALSAPIIFYQLWAFIAPGLYSREKKYVIPFVFFSTVLFVGGGWFGWRVAIPLAFRYFLSLTNEGSGGGVVIHPLFMVGDYIDFCLQVMLGFGVAFELPMLLLFLGIAGIVNHLMLIRYARWFIFAAFVIAALLAPPDVVSMLVMAFPLVVLYGLSIGLVYAFGKPPTDAQRAAYKGQKKAAEA